MLGETQAKLACSLFKVRVFREANRMNTTTHFVPERSGDKTSVTAPSEAACGADLYARHLPRFEAAQAACRDRGHWSAFVDHPELYPSVGEARRAGGAAYQAQLGRPFELSQPGTSAWLGEETSPYTGQPLGIAYPQADADALFTAGRSAMPSWAQAEVNTRIGVLMEVVDVLYREHIFELAFAVMHTAGQSFNMAFTGSGVNALDRAIEALVHAHQALQNVPSQARWTRPFGAGEICLEKTYRRVPRGVALCFACATFPTWNAWPSMMASLATGNAVIVKPHPACVLPMAISVRVFRQVLQAAGFDPNLVTLCLDSVAEPQGKRLVQHPSTAIVDFTGSARFGQWVERNAGQALVFTETSGCNTVVLTEADDLDAALRSLATSLCLFSAQMCTSPQNIYLPHDGVLTPQGRVSVQQVGERLVHFIDQIAGDPRRAAMMLATLQSAQTRALLEELTGEGARRGQVLRHATPYVHPEFPQARTASPLLIQVSRSERVLYGEERFGPVAFLIVCEDAQAALQQACADVAEFGGLTAFVYAKDPGFIARAEEAYAIAGAQLTLNLTGPMPLNFAAAYSDYHVSGLNPAGNACLTDLAFVSARFRIAQVRRPARPLSCSKEG